MTIGVVMTVYNLDRFAAEAIESVLRQTVKPSRVIVINDGSTDHSLEIIRKYSGKVEIINNPGNLGVLPSVLLGIRKLDTDIVAMIDGDDRWVPEKLARVRDRFLSDPGTMIVTHSFRCIDKDGLLIEGQQTTLKNLESIAHQTNGDPVETDTLLKESILGYRGVWLGSAFSIRRESFKIDEFDTWSKSMWGHELSHQDQPIAAFMIMTQPGLAVGFVDEELFDYRIFGANSSGTSSTLAKAMQTLLRSKATLTRTRTAVEKMPGRKTELKRQTAKLREIEYLERLYSRQFGKAFPIFVSLLTHWTPRESMKELSRFAGVMILGPERFLKYK
jgi:glycosyltransferase involved in cell wall biosynthesis